MRLQLIQICTLICIAIAATNSLADDVKKTTGVMTPDQLRAAGFKPLIEGNSLAAWDVKPGHEHHWTLHDGVINYQANRQHQTE